MNDWLTNPVPNLDAERLDQARAHQGQLTKPAGSLGQLEHLAITLSAMQQTLEPSLEHAAIRIFAADHGVVAEGVSAFPQAVTVEMIRNFANGGAAVTVLANELNADFEVINMGTAEPVPELPRVLQRPVAAGTANFCNEPAMSSLQLSEALSIGRSVADEAISQGAQIFIGGEMGIGNTTTAAALAAALLREPAEELVGAGTGVDGDGLQRKIMAVKRGLEQHQARLDEPTAILQCLGGFEIAALVGAYINCAQHSIPSLVDGFICSVAALVATRINPGVRHWLLFSHQSAEQGHIKVLEAMDASPLLSLGMRLGEGSGAAVALPLLRLACSLHNGMATFDSAGVSDKTAQ